MASDRGHLPPKRATSDVMESNEKRLAVILVGVVVAWGEDVLDRMPLDSSAGTGATAQDGGPGSGGTIEEAQHGGEREVPQLLFSDEADRT